MYHCGVLLHDGVLHVLSECGGVEGGSDWMEDGFEIMRMMSRYVWETGMG